MLKLVNISRTESGSRILLLPYAPPLSSVRARTARSQARENTPAWPATPSKAYAFSSCTSPHTSPRPSADHGGRSTSVAAIAGFQEAGGL